MMPIDFPMIRAGGLFILLVGVGVLLGGAFASHRKLLLALAAAAASVAVANFAVQLTRPFGTPSASQIGALAGAVALEAVLVRVAIVRYRRSPERDLLLAILLAVGIHFIPMALAFGPLCAPLGACAVANAGTGLWFVRRAPLRCFWIVDGALKVCFGAWMLSATPAVTNS